MAQECADFKFFIDVCVYGTSYYERAETFILCGGLYFRGVLFMEFS